MTDEILNQMWNAKECVTGKFNSLILSKDQTTNWLDEVLFSGISVLSSYEYNMPHRIGRKQEAKELQSSYETVTKSMTMER